MSERERLHRQDASRTGPRRDFSFVYRRPAENPKSEEHTAVEGEQPRANFSSPTGSARESVELAYQVIQKHIDAGRRAAEDLGENLYKPRSASDSFQQVLEKTLSFQAEILPVWLEVIGALSKGSSAAGAFTPGTAADQNGNPTAYAPTWTVEVISARPLEVSLDIRPHSQTLALATPGLQSIDNGTLALTAIDFFPQHNGSRPKVRISIPEGQASGTFSGVVVNREGGEVRGTMSVRIK